MKTIKIKLLNIGEIDGVTRLQSQMWVGRDSCDFLLEKGKLYNYKYGSRGVDFYETNIHYEIVKTKEEMNKQQL